MQQYRNLSGNSGVTAYEIRPKSIIVRFQDGWKYEYTDETSGAAAVAEMRRRALAGKGLSTFISQRVGDLYERRFR